MKIAFVNTNRGWGGAEEQMLVMARELTLRGHDVTVIVRRGGPMEKRFSRSGQRVFPVERTGLQTIVSLFRAAAWARKECFEIIHCHRDHDLPLGKLLSIVTAAPLLLTQHCLPRRPSALIYGLTDRIITVSEYIAAGIRVKLPRIGGRLGVIVNGIELARFTDPDRQFWRRHPLVGERRPLLGVVGAFYKGQEELIAMLPALREQFPQVALILIGEDEGRKAPLVAKAEQLGVADSVVFAGRIPRERMKDALGSLDLNVSTFRNEGFGLSVVEGLAVGTPFVGYRAGGYPEIIKQGQNGFLANSGEEFVSLLNRLLAEENAHIHSLSENCIAEARKFSLERMIASYLKQYEEIRIA